MIFRSLDEPDTERFPVILAVRKVGRELALDAGETMAAYVTCHLLRSILNTAAGAGDAGLTGENAVACFLHLCRETCENLCEPAQLAGGAELT